MKAVPAISAPDRPAAGRGGVVATVLLLVAAAVSRWLAFLPPELPIATIAWLACFTVAAVGARSARVLLIAAYLIELLWWLAVQRWVVDVTAAGYPALCGVLAVWAVVLAWALRRFASRAPTARIPLWVVLPTTLVACDLLRGEFVLGGYPWYEAGQGIAGLSGFGNQVAQSADLLGVRGLTMVAAAIAGAIAEFARPDRLRPRRVAATAAGLAVVVAALLAYGSWRLGQSQHLPALARALAVQTALPIDNKIGWTAERQVEDVAEFARATQEAVERCAPPVDLVAWPETMLPGLGLDPETLEMAEREGYFPGRLFGDLAHTVARGAGAPLLVGSPSYVGLVADSGRWRWDARFNSVYLVPPSLPDRTEPPRYDKIVLTPFGETMPLISRFEALERALLDIGARGMTFDLDAGSEPIRFEIRTAGGELVRVATPICFEATVASLCRRLVWEGGRRAADLLVNASNDGWLGSDDSARRMHLRLAALRAIENRTPMLRAVNTGFSAGIDSSGRVIAGLDGSPERLGTEAGWVLAEFARDDRVPPFAIIGDRWALAAVLMVLAGWWATRARVSDSIRDNA